MLVTGAGGFVGRHVLAAAEAAGARAAGTGSAGLPSLGNRQARDDLVSGEAASHWRELMHGIDAVVHLAGRAHVRDGGQADTESAFERDNTELTFALARVAADAGVRRFVFLSTIGVNGTSTDVTPFAPDDRPNPASPYARSKWHAEQRLWEIASNAGLEVAIVRPPLVYGAGAPGNIRRLARVVERGWPMPFGAVRNRRHFMNVEDLADLLVRCALRPEAAGRLFLAADAVAISTPELIRCLGDALGRPARLFPVPPSLLALGTRLVGQPQLVDQLLRSLEIRIEETKQTLDWVPRRGLHEGLRAMAADMRGSQGNSDTSQ
ncbi:NAD-dependent epimerase/dehydratase family protein [Ferruginivarius sediminum]|uniref:NAD-dependent epimerase/dehydratase family protein n=1 Tax=Ferruginivarius sediminum TaxID=2661937 RepID=A0A369TG88_9PROT|nr:NAD-dependent epimerase/dehydratase family protein [Ferruginivarius sediminum]